MEDRTEQIEVWWAGLSPDARDRARASVESGILDSHSLISLAQARILVASEGKWLPNDKGWTFLVPDDVAEFIARMGADTP